ncbi:DDE-type integrase/transposase/recombinase [Flavobacterium columnare]|uniref:Transposase family protein n=1 Tax=Flavobacterium columnare TaxID=996 RepID=A0AAI8CFI7_9FLAO|nr:DDE-type integrase/transposase/recombinase [Flavobacterium columnare]AMO19219.1 transposase family protein [Flavobacterium columnare]AUX17150.1 hypothetical protein AQ623_01630 [Flavobacterium columnare]QOG56169.1 DDE-type integrase/transposase/recombinase [Flavobacterium columnare]QOG58892.1 DDE-type integrase/transposase/recombinase [Flavobacterium columnare]QOG61614.1 DDE-type integrase/transposase/recombinase [Flavobacterium columnare]
MNLLHNDIIIRNYKDGETIWVSQRLVMQMCGISEDYLRQAARERFKKSIQKGYKYGDFLPNTGSAWRWGKANGTFYYDYDCLPDRKPTHYRSKFGTKHELLQAYEALLSADKNNRQNQLKNLIQAQVNAFIDNTDITYYMYSAIVGFNQNQAIQMATGRAWCMFINKQLFNDNFKGLGINKKQDFLQVCADMIAPLQLEGFKVNSAAYLRNKINEFPIDLSITEQRNFFVSGKYGNDNAQIVGKYPLIDESTGQIYQFDIHQAMMFHLYMNPGASSKEYIRTLWERDYCEDVREFDLQPVAYRTFCHHLTRFNKSILTAKARHGEDYYKKHVQTYVTTDSLQYAHSLFAGDGSGTINYKYRKPNGKWATMKLYVILITDVSSRFIAGWSAAPMGSHKETESMTKEAVKMAIENGGNQTMFEFVSDNHGAFTSAASKSFLNLAFNKVRTIEAGNSQANPAETQFRLFKRSLKDIQNFLSTSWGTGIEGQANPDHINIDDMPSYEDALIQMHELIKRWNQMQLRDKVTPAERWQIKHPDCKPLEPVVMRYLFAKHTKVDVSYMRGYVNVYRSQGYSSEQFQFEIPNFGGAGTEMIAKATGYTSGAEVKVVWDEDFADLYTLDEKFIMTCPRVIGASQSHAETDDTKANALGHLKGRKAKQTEIIDEFEASLNEVINDLGYSHAMALGSNKETYNENQLNKVLNFSFCFFGF